MTGQGEIYIGKTTNTETYATLQEAIIAVLLGETNIALAPGNYVIASNADIEPEFFPRYLLAKLDKPLKKPVGVYPFKADITSYINEIRQILEPLTNPAQIALDRLVRINEITTDINAGEDERMKSLKIVHRLSNVPDYNTDDITIQKDDVELILRLPSGSYVWSVSLDVPEDELVKTEDKGLIRLKYIPYEGLESDLILVESLVSNESMKKIEEILKVK